MIGEYGMSKLAEDLLIFSLPDSCAVESAVIIMRAKYLPNIHTTISPEINYR